MEETKTTEQVETSAVVETKHAVIEEAKAVPSKPLSKEATKLLVQIGDRSHSIKRLEHELSDLHKKLDFLIESGGLSE